MSAILRNRWALLFAVVVAVVAVSAYLVVTLGTVNGTRSPSGTVAISDTAALRTPGPDGTAAPASTAVAAPTPSALAPTSPAASPSVVATVAKPTPAKSTAPVAAKRVSASTARTGSSRRVTFVNRTTQKIWVAGGQQTAKPALKTTGWVLPAGKSLTITVPNKWNGRFWGRTGCSFNSAGKGHCATGDCGGVFQCKGYGSIPATLAEYNFDAWQGLDFYDVSMVDGSNLPMYINHTGGTTKDAISKTGCSSAGCTTAVKCPKKLSVDGGAGCESPCAKLGGAQYCCQGKWAPRSECDPTKWPVDYAKVFKTAEPFAYSYVDDDATSTFTCKGRCDYRITFGLTPK